MGGKTGGRAYRRMPIEEKLAAWLRGSMAGQWVSERWREGEWVCGSGLGSVETEMIEGGTDI